MLQRWLRGALCAFGKNCRARSALQAREAFQTRWNIDVATVQLEGTAGWLWCTEQRPSLAQSPARQA